MAKYVVALSGGADSVCLLLHLLKRGEVGVAAHCNFHLRGEESNRDEAFVRELCSEKGVTLEVRHFDTQREASVSGESIEMVARRLRYEWFAQLVEQYGCDAVAVGHHQEDNAETILLNMSRAAGLQGLTGMQPLSVNAGLRVYRPLLSMTKKQILDQLQACGQTYVTDSTNADVHYKRNRIRHHILPEFQQLNPQFVSTINQMARHLSEAYQLYRERVGEIASSCLLSSVKNHPKFQQIRYDLLLKSGHAPTVLHELLMPYDFSEAQVESLLTMKVGGIVSSSQGIATRSEKMLIFGPSIERTIRKDLLIPENIGAKRHVLVNDCIIEATLLQRSDIRSLRCEKDELLIDASAIVGPLYVRSVAEAERFYPFGMKGSRLLSDYMTDRHFSRIEKALSLVVCDDKGIIWLVGERGDERGRIMDKTEQIVRLSVKPRKA